MSEVIVVGDDTHGLTDRFGEAGCSVSHLEGWPVGSDLDENGIAEAGALVVTEANLASVIAVAKERNDRVMVVLYSSGRLPPYASAQTDLAVDPALVNPEGVVEAIIDRLAEAP